MNKTNQLNELINSIVDDKDINLEFIDSYFTYLEKAIYFFSKKDYKKSIFYSKKTLADSSLIADFRTRAEYIHKRAELMLRNNI